MKKVVINSCYGGFGLSYVALMRLREMGNEHALKEVAPGESYCRIPSHLVLIAGKASSYLISPAINESAKGCE